MHRRVNAGRCLSTVYAVLGLQIMLGPPGGEVGYEITRQRSRVIEPGTQVCVCVCVCVAANPFPSFMHEPVPYIKADSHHHHITCHAAAIMLH